MKEAAIITLYDDVNLGNKLQNYALQEVLEGMGLRASSLVCKEMLYSPRKLPLKRQIKKLLLPSLRKQQRLFRQRTQRFRVFSEKHLRKGERVSFRDKAMKALGHYDYFVVGSDQVWHNWRNKRAELDYFFLRFADAGKRVCYAPSFGFDSVPEKYRDAYAEGLRGFPELCCRERSGCELIRELTGREAQLVCDPTLLLSDTQWDAISKKPEYEVPERFMLVYFLGGQSQQVTDQIQRLARKQGLEVIDLYGPQVKEHYLTAPDEFLYLMRRAAYVCTDSFHGSVFSTLYRKPFYVFSRGDSSGAKMGNRISTLLEQLGIVLENVPGEEPEAFWKDNYARAEQRMDSLRQTARQYLERVLSK